MGKPNICREIARHIVLAQVASDAGKGIFALQIKGKDAEKAQKYGYSVKDAHIAKAIELINKNKLCGFYTKVVKGLDQRGNPSKIIYFNCCLANGKRCQVSFHSFKYYKLQGPAIEWDHKNSRESCCQLIDFYSL